MLAAQALQALRRVRDSKTTIRDINADTLAALQAIPRKHGIPTAPECKSSGVTADAGNDMVWVALEAFGENL